MMRPPRPKNAAKPTTLGNVSSNNPFTSVLNNEGLTDEGQEPAILSDTSDDEDDDNDDSSSVSSSRNDDTQNDHAQRQRPPRPSMAAARASLLPSHSRNRRRSSARFLSLHRGGRDSMQSIRTARTSHGGGSAEPPANLTELYQKAIRMNAENKINAGNSWNLKLIENIDMFLGDNDDDEEDEGHPTNRTAQENENDPPNRKRVNFTKASCTLDASVKIYGYRVDDVHLTSYKVLANLNRSSHSSSDTNTNNPNSNSDTVEADDGATEKSVSRTKSSHNGNTLETHIANINLNKLDSAFDIDPLFHKMSKSFDEGGAKGLLLVNLGVGEHGCNIVFDSAASESDEESAQPQRTGDDNNNSASTNNEPRLPEGMMDISSLTQKLEALLLDENSTIHDLPLVPQLTGLRAELEALEREGFVDGNALLHTVGPKTPGRRRYHANVEDEHHADRTIHKEALERSQRRSLGALNLAARLQEDGDDGYAMAGDDDFDDYGGGGGFDDGDDDDDFDTFIQTNAPRYSDISLSSAANQNSTNPSGDHTSSDNATSNFLDAIASGQALLSESDYSFFNEASQSGNVWAGAAHWKRAANNHKQRGMAKTKTLSTNKSATQKKKEPKSAKNKKVALVCLDCETPDLSHLFAKKGKRKTTAATNTTQWSKAMITKHTANENLLPEDAQVKVEQLTQLFLRPLAVLQPVTTSRDNSVTVPGDSDDHAKNKSVMFHLPNWDDGSIGGGGGGDDDGPGYDFGGGDGEGEDEFLVQELDGVRKVEKIQVGFAVVAKQVDVKRLKRDLWLELEQKFGKSQETDDDENSSLDPDADDDPLETPKCVSFQKAVDDLEQQKTQMDVTLPFYFICILHLANERGLRLESQGLDDFTIHEQ